MSLIRIKKIQRMGIKQAGEIHCALQMQIDDRPDCVYDKVMNYEWDETKRAANLAKHGIDFTKAEHFEWPTAIEAIDDRLDYGEERWGPLVLSAIGFMCSHTLAEAIKFA